MGDNEARFYAHVMRKCAEAHRDGDVEVRLQCIAECKALLQEKEAPESMPEHLQAQGTLEDRLSAFRSWLEQGGVDLSKVVVGETEGCGLGVICKETLKKEEAAFAVPRKLMITLERVEEVRGKVQTEAFKAVKQALRQDVQVRAIPSVMLGLVLLAELERGTESFFKAYFDVLPKDYSYLPLNWNPDLLRTLGDTEAGLTGVNIILMALRLYCHIKLKYGSAFKHFNFRLFTWALSVAMSRQNPLPLKEDPAQKTLALMPLFDMCNHASGEMSSFYESESDALVCNAMKEFRQGDELVIFYGPRSNAQLLLYSGFSMKPGENEFDVVSAMLDFDEKDSLIPLKLQLAQELKMNATVELSIEENNSGAIQAARIVVADREELSKILSAIQAQNQSGQKQVVDEVSRDNEIKSILCLLCAGRECIKMREKLAESAEGVVSQYLQAEIATLKKFVASLSAASRETGIRNQESPAQS